MGLIKTFPPSAAGFPSVEANIPSFPPSVAPTPPAPTLQLVPSPDPDFPLLGLSGINEAGVAVGDASNADYSSQKAAFAQYIGGEWVVTLVPSPDLVNFPILALAAINAVGVAVGKTNSGGYPLTAEEGVIYTI